MIKTNIHRHRKVFYNVLAPYDYNLVSCCQNSDMPDEYRVIYNLNKWVTPNIENTKLFVFDNLKSARNWNRRTFGNNLYIYSCYGKNPEIFYPAEVHQIRYFWRNFKENSIFRDKYQDTIKHISSESSYGSCLRDFEIETGTSLQVLESIGVDAVRLIKRVY